MAGRYESVEGLLAAAVGRERAHELVLLAHAVGSQDHGFSSDDSEFQAYAQLFAAFHKAYVAEVPFLQDAFPLTRAFEFEVARHGCRRAYGNDGVDYRASLSHADGPAWDGSGVPAWNLLRRTRPHDAPHAWGFRRRTGCWCYHYRDEVDHVLTYALMREAQAWSPTARATRHLEFAYDGSVKLLSAFGLKLEPGMYVALAELLHGPDLELVGTVAAGALWLKGCGEVYCEPARLAMSRNEVKGCLRAAALA